MKLISWNVNGIRSIYRKGLDDFLAIEKPDILCLQETKISINSLDELPANPNNYDCFFSSAEKPGYSGVSTYIKDEIPHLTKDPDAGIGISEFDNEGRFLITDHGDFVLYNIYFPSGTTGDLRQNFKYKFLDSTLEHIKSLPKNVRDKLIICGDYNICHKEIDIHHPDVATKRELSGFLPEERAWMDKLTASGFTDSFRAINGDVQKQYTWWTYRAGARDKNLGWRIDYFFVANNLAKKIKSAKILNNIKGSDHCPITLELAL